MNVDAIRTDFEITSSKESPTERSTAQELASQKLWLMWQVAVRVLGKQSFAGIPASREAAVAKRRAKNKVARASRKANR